MARAKNAKCPLPGVPWLLVLASHAGIHAWAVSLVLPWQFAAFEFLAHGITDHLKCTGRLGSGERAFAVDQAIHLALKVAYVAIAM